MSSVSVSVEGHCLITDDLNHVHLNQLNSIHSENMSRAIARGLAHEFNNGVFRIAFGIGGTTFTNQKIVYNPVRDTGWNTTLYNEVYSKSAQFGSSFDTIKNTKTTSGVGTASLDKDRISQTVISCTLGKDEPSSLNNIVQLSRDFQPVNYNALADKYYVESGNPFIFDEIGLFTDGVPLTDINGFKNNPIDSSVEFRRLLTHLTFSPVMKTGNRIFNIKYTLTVYVNRTVDAPSLTIIQPS